MQLNFFKSNENLRVLIKMISTRKAVILSAALSLAFAAGLVIWALGSGSASEGEAILALPAPSEAILTGGNDPNQIPLELLPGELIDINSATAEELTILPGIGDSLAKAIVAYRGENGTFDSLEQLMEVPGIGEGRFAAIEDKICLGESVE